MSRKWMLLLTAFCIISIWLAGCARPPSGPPPSPEPGQPVVLHPVQPPPVRIGPDLPGWVARGSGIYQYGSERSFRGVGMATTLSGNRLLMRTAADNLARREVGEVLRRYMAALADQGQAVEPGGDSLDELVQEGLRQAVVSDHWTDPRDGRMYALCRLELQQFKDILARSNVLEMSLRNTWLEKADRLHDRMAASP